MCILDPTTVGEVKISRPEQKRQKIGRFYFTTLYSRRELSPLYGWPVASGEGNSTGE